MLYFHLSMQNAIGNIANDAADWNTEIVLIHIALTAELLSSSF